MKKFLIISDGTIGKHLVDRIVATYSSENLYYIIQPGSVEKPADANPSQYKFFNFDPTSFHKLANVLKMDFAQVFVAMATAKDTEITIKNIRTMKKQLRVVVLDQFGISFEDPNVVSINSNELLASRLIDYLPNVPVIAQNVGLGKGEIMEILVPFGSSFVYRHIGVIEQRNWRIIGIYRNRELILPKRRTMIHPNDLLLLIGEPSVLKSVYRAIKRELGQFPAPFGSNLYLHIDMRYENEKSIRRLLEQATFIHQELGKDLIVKVFNPNDFDLLRHIKSYRSSNVIIEINYQSVKSSDITLNDVKQFHVGLILVSRDCFSYQSMRKTLFEANVPVLSLSEKDISDIKEAIVLVSDNRDLEKVSTAIFDISAQMGYNLELFNFRSEHQEEKEQVIEHYNNLASIFSKSIKVIEQDQNPIRTLRQKDNFLQCLPFTEKMTERPILSLFSTDSERLYHRLNRYHQLFIPVRI
ncbi:MAG: TrkA C-terminal domain-containing protein [Campylobacterota bacterium]|nr:TrkA C-terminal domain-containing protein [Campylobacterota bacterium]